MKRQRVGFREAMRSARRPEPEYLYRTFQGTPGHPKLQQLTSEGWEVQGSDPVLLAGTTLRQRVWTLRKPNPNFRRVDVTVDLGAGCKAS
jgi:hypothetical protein